MKNTHKVWLSLVTVLITFVLSNTLCCNYARASDDQSMNKIALTYICVMERYGIDKEKMTAVAGLTYSICEELGLRSENQCTQAILLGTILFNNRMTNLGPGETVDKGKTLIFSMQSAARMLNSRGYENLIWILRARFKKDGIGVEFQKIADKLRKIEPLTSEEWELIRDDSKRMKAFDGTADDYVRTRTLTSTVKEVLDFDTSYPAMIAQMELERLNAKDVMGWKTSRIWCSDVNEIVGEECTYKTADELRDVYMQLTDVVSAERASYILSGSTILTDNEQNLVKKYCGEEFLTKIKAFIKIASMQNDEEKNRVRTQILYASTYEAKQLEMPLSDLNTIRAPFNKQDFGFIQTQVNLLMEVREK